ncbi:otu domain-containing protein ddb_g0284757 [Phtheirospermum japonicum]|uniref:Otu domain-containing protein ddb_g0284757 n=1 Tax=Phtheirospermum japonicum TaxID=374723 RepID=A0A830CBL4_9LAMI|nr:otu domain-containing protein ddb_g0284757 [Phtheirospermum japonicum]
MTTYQLDPDFVRWGLHLIDVCSLSNDGSPQTLTCYENDISRTESVTEGFYNPTCSFVESDEIIALALQEELSKLAASDASGFTNHSSPGFQCNQEKKEKEDFSFENECQGILPHIEDESYTDGELGKRLNQMHVPKVNGVIPSADEATSDHQRLLNRLQLYELTELKILGDGNCQIYEMIMRKLSRFSIMSFEDYQIINAISYASLHDYRSGEWGDHVTLQAAADCYGIKIFVITSFKDTCYIEILPQTEKSNRIIFLSFWAEVHYNSIYPLGELPVVEGKKKKRRWWT